MTWHEQRELVDRFNDEGVAARQGFKSMLQQAEYNSAYSEGVTKAISLQHEVIYLPLSDTMTHANAESICHSLMRHAKIVIPKLTRIE
tara:strand:- start:517 stop:780 length:264 start_codon:yes stop_codon:yes gene_type:complete